MAILIILMLLSLAALAWAIYEPFTLQVHESTMPVEGLPQEFEGLRVVFLTDVHYGRFYGRERLVKLVQQANALKPDIVLLGGDYAENAEDYRECMQELSKLRAELGVFAVSGNHDCYMSGEELARVMRENSITPADRESYAIERNGARLHIAGVPYLSKHFGETVAFEDISAGETALLLAHNPQDVKAAQGEFSLAFAGHTHGGQVTLFGLLGIWSRPLPAYTSPWVTIGGVRTLCSNGIGTTLLPLRFMAPPQLHVVTLTNAG